MKIYAWWPETYGEWAFVQADSVEQAKQLLAATKHKDFPDEWSKQYHSNMVDEMLKENLDVIEPYTVTFGEVA